MKPKSPRTLARLSDAQCLAAMSRAVFAAGFQPRIVDAMWPGIREVMDAFEPARVARYSKKKLDALMDDTRVIRHRPKLEGIVGCSQHDHHPGRQFWLVKNSTRLRLVQNPGSQESGRSMRNA